MGQVDNVSIIDAVENVVEAEPATSNYSIEFTKTKVNEISVKGANYEVSGSLGKLRVSHYCGCRTCNGKWYGQPTASGTKLTEGRTIAVDAKNPIVPLGTKLLINGKVYTAEDTGNLNKYGRQLDMFIDDHAECYRLGVRTYDVKVVK